jgi:hypothetical protein
LESVTNSLSFGERQGVEEKDDFNSGAELLARWGVWKFPGPSILGVAGTLEATTSHCTSSARVSMLRSPELTANIMGLGAAYQSCMPVRSPACLCSRTPAVCPSQTAMHFRRPARPAAAAHAAAVSLSASQQLWGLAWVQE